MKQARYSHYKRPDENHYPITPKACLMRIISTRHATHLLLPHLRTYLTPDA